jgi:hypothetical protein
MSGMFCVVEPRAVLRGDRACTVGRETRNAFGIVIGNTVWKALARIMGAIWSLLRG